MEKTDSIISAIVMMKDPHFHKDSVLEYLNTGLGGHTQRYVSLETLKELWGGEVGDLREFVHGFQGLRILMSDEKLKIGTALANCMGTMTTGNNRGTAAVLDINVELCKRLRNVIDFLLSIPDEEKAVRLVKSVYEHIAENV